MEIIVKNYNGKDVKAVISPLNKRHTSIKPMKDVPKCWKYISCFETSINNLYNQSLMRIYQAKDGLRFSMFRDGCFYEYCGRILIK